MEKYINIKTNKIYTEKKAKELNLLASPDVYRYRQVEPIISLDSMPIYDGTYKIEGNTVLDIPTMVDPTLDYVKKQAKKLIEIQGAEYVVVNDVAYNSGTSSASAITGAVQLAQSLGEVEVSLWDVNNVVQAPITFEEALNIAAEIGKEYRDAKINYYSKLEAIDNATTIEEVKTIVQG